MCILYFIMMLPVEVFVPARGYVKAKINNFFEMPISA